MSKQPPFILISGLEKHFHMGSTTVLALDGVDIEISRNSFTVVMGPSGSGKTTLLYLVGGLDRPTGGQIAVDGQRLDEMDENKLALFRRQTVGFIFQSFNLIASMTAEDNVGFPMQFAGIAPRQRARHSKELLEQVGLGDRRQHHPDELSGGQQQRVAIARALVNNPELILADEPTGNLDTHSSLEIMDLLANLNKQGRTIVMVTHDPDIAHYTKRIIHIRDGKIESDRMNGIRPVIAGAEASHGPD
jgi:putative ABC transport system ATP-binding protein